MCQECARDHEPEHPHDAQTLYYQTKFNMGHGRSVTWRDAMAHCTPEMQQEWAHHLEEMGIDIDKPGRQQPVVPLSGAEIAELEGGLRTLKEILDGRSVDS